MNPLGGEMKVGGAKDSGKVAGEDEPTVGKETCAKPGGEGDCADE